MKCGASQEARGFTLLELLVVMAIAALIFGLAIPSYHRVKSQASSAACAGKLRDIGIAVNAYTGDHGLRLPVMAAARDNRKEDIPVMDTVLLEYVKDEITFQCPSDHKGLFEKSGSSYFWNSLINGQMTGNMNFLGFTKNSTRIPIVSDKENFHKNVGDEVNILYADGHVKKKLQFVVDPH